MKKNSKFYSEKLVQRLNELYYDFTNEQYHNSHPEIFIQERERWERIARQFLNFTNPITIVDIGTGSGFVPLTIAKFTKKEDIFICSDISKDILDIAKHNIEKQNFHCKLKFVKIKNQVPYQLPFEIESIDVITMNSVLHHVKDTNTFLGQIDRVLKPNGLLFIGHEPNKYFYDNKFLLYNYLIIDPKFIVYKLFKRLHLEKIIKKIYYLISPKKKDYKKITNKINEVLLREKLIKKSLLCEEIDEIKDIKAQEGFQPDSLLPHYKLLLFETYNHIFRVIIKHYNNSIIRKYDNLLKTKYPKDGATFFIVLKK